MFSPSLRAALALLVATFVHADQWTNPPTSGKDLDTPWVLGSTVRLAWNISRTINPISIKLRHWNESNTLVGTVMDSGTNVGYFDWIIGLGDGVDATAITFDRTFVLDLSDPSGNTGSPGGGWVSNTLSSLGFVIKTSPAVSSSASHIHIQFDGNTFPLLSFFRIRHIFYRNRSGGSHSASTSAGSSSATSTGVDIFPTSEAPPQA